MKSSADLSAEHEGCAPPWRLEQNLCKLIRNFLKCSPDVSAQRVL